MNIGIKIVERKPIVEGSPRLICGNSGDTITFTFDSEWGNYTAKVARFVYVKNGVVESQEVLFNGNVAEIPVLSNITEVFIGVYTGDLRTTTPVTIPCDFSILCKGGEPVDPTPDIYAQILDALNAKLILEGNASSASKLETPRTIQVDLENSNGASFDGTEDVNPGVIGVLPIENGGTGVNTPEGVRDNLSLDTFYAPHAVKRVNGSAVAVNDSSNSPLANLKLYGKTEQDGTPTPDNPIELKSVGDSGSYEVGVYGKNLCNCNATTQTLNGVTCTNNGDGTYTLNGTATTSAEFKLTSYFTLLEGVRYILSGCSSGGAESTYNLKVWAKYGNFCKASDYGNGSAEFVFEKDTDVNLGVWVKVFNGVTVSNLVVKPMIRVASVTDSTYEAYNKQSITFTGTLRSVNKFKDEKDFTKGITTQRIQEVIFTGTEDFYADSTGFMLSMNSGRALTSTEIQTISTHFAGANTSWNSQPNNTIQAYNLLLKIRCDDYATVDDFKTFLAEQYASGNPVKMQYALYTQKETPISESELNAYRHLMTNKGNSTILSEANLEVDYYTDTLSGEALGNIHSQVHNNYLKLQQAIISLVGGNTL